MYLVGQYTNVLLFKIQFPSKMKKNNNTILITGGGSGIGFELAKIFSESQNHVIIAGRDEDKLKNASERLSNVKYIKCDVTDEESISSLVEKLEEDYPELNVLINNAGAANYYNLGTKAGAYEKAKSEITVNYLAPILLTEKLLPVLLNKAEAAVINISSIAAYSPGLVLPTYSASKAALHSYTQILRLTLSVDTAVKVFEVLPPLVDTEFAAALTREKMSPVTVAEDIFRGFEDDVFEMRIGSTAAFYELMLQSPENALLSRNGMLNKK